MCTGLASGEQVWCVLVSQFAEKMMKKTIFIAIVGIFGFLTASVSHVHAAPRTLPFLIGQTVDPGAETVEPCGPADANCFPAQGTIAVAATTGAGTLATDFEAGDTIDGVVLATGDVVIIKDQASPTENGFYRVNASGAPTLLTAAKGASGFVTGGTLHSSKEFFVVDGTVTISEQAGGGSSEWTDLGTILHPNESAVDEIAIGGTSEAGADIFLGADGAAVFNEQGLDSDIRFEGDTEANLLYLDASVDRVGLGISTPGSRLHVREIFTTATGGTQTLSAHQANYDVADTGTKSSINASALSALGAGTLADLSSLRGTVNLTGAGTITDATGLYTQIINSNAAGIITNAYGLYIDDSTETGTITNDYGLYQVDTSAMNYFGGDVGLGTTTPGVALDIAELENTQAIRFHDNTNSDSSGIYFGNATPEGTVTAQLGSIFIDNSSGDLYVKNGNDGGATGWAMLGTASTTDFDGVYDQSVTNTNLVMEIDNGSLEFESSGTNNFIVDLQGTGDFLIQDGGVTRSTFADDGSFTNTILATFEDLVVNGNTDLGDNVGDTLTITATLDSGLGFDTDDTYDIGDTDEGVSQLFLADGTDALVFGIGGGAKLHLGYDNGTESLVFNDPGAERNIRIEGDTNPNAFFFEALDSQFGFNTLSPDAQIDIENAENTEVLRFTDSTNSDSSGIYFGNATPESTVSAQLGSLFIDNATGDLYVKDSDDGLATGWVMLGTASTTDFDGVYDNSVNNTNLTMEIDNGSLVFQGTGANNFDIDLAGTGDFRILDGGTATHLFNDDGTIVFNEAGADADIRFEGDTQANLLYLDASTDRIGIGTSTPGEFIDMVETGNVLTRVRLMNTNGGGLSSPNFRVQADNAIGGLSANSSASTPANLADRVSVFSQGGATGIDLAASSVGSTKR